jgi:prolyl 4-hydroxylase
MQIHVPGRGRPYLEGDSLDHSAPLVFGREGVMSAAECGELVTRIDAMSPAAAPITTSQGFVMRPDIRNNERVMFDDVVLAAELFRRVEGVVPARLFGRRALGVNERFRGYRYQPGQRFAPHYDGAFRRSGKEASELTFMVYLNEELTGGKTAFLDFDVEVTPKTGAALFFQHQLLHEGAEVKSGVKYVLRTDVMYAE